MTDFTISMTQLQDRESIRELLAEYCFAVDNRWFPEMAALFTETGTWETAFGVATGQAEIEQLMRKLMPPFGAGPRAIHSTTNIVIKLDGDRAKVTSNWFVIRNGDQRPSSDSGGFYIDRLVKQNGRWLFQHRTIDRFINTGSNLPPP